MDLLIFIAGLLGFVFFVIRLVINAIKKESKKKQLIGLGICFALMIIAFGMNPLDNNMDRPDKPIKESSSTNKVNTTIEQKKIEQEKADKDNDIDVDVLQQLYLKFSDDVIKEDLITTIKENNLFYSEKEYSGGPTIKVAFEEDVSRLSHAKSGDYIKLSFNKELEVEHIEYFSNDKFLSLIDYRKGTYWSFRDQPEYKGYYINSPGKKLGTFKIKYDNGNEVETDYIKVDSKEEQLQFLFNYKG